MSAYNVMIMYANNELGFAFMRQLLSLPNVPKYIFAINTIEEDVKDLMNFEELSDLSKVIFYKIDLNQPLEDCLGAIETEVQQIVGDRGIELLINISCFPSDEDFSLPLECLKKQFQAGVITSLMPFQIMTPLLEDAAYWNNDGSKAIFFNVVAEKNSNFSNPVSEVNKVALNLALNEMATKVHQKNISVLSSCLDFEDDRTCKKELEKNIDSYLLEVFCAFQSQKLANLMECYTYKL